MTRISNILISSDRESLLSERIGLRPVAILLAGLQLFMPVSVSVASVAQAVSAPDKNEQLNHDNQLATHLARAAGLVQADSSQAAKSYATGLASGAVNSAAGEWLSQFGTAQVNLGLDQNLKAAGSSLDMLVPLYDSPKAMLFTQFGARHQDSRNTVNIGAGVRTFTDSNWMLGGNVFLDNDLTGKNRRLGLGVEAWTDHLKLSGNHYFGLTDWHQSRDFADYDERPANGYDLRLEGFLPSLPQLGGKLMYEKYFGQEVALFNKDERQKNPSAFTFGLNWTPFPLITFGAEHRAGSHGNNDTQINMGMTIRPGDSLASHLDSTAVADTRLLAKSRTDLVERNNNIVLDYKKQELISLTLPSSLTGPAGTELTVKAVLKSKYDIRGIDWQAPNLVADGGQLRVSGTDTLSVSLPRSAHALPYVLSGVAQDMNGNFSDRVVTYITVTDAPVSVTNSVMSVTPPVLPADGESKSIVKVELRNSANAPVSGQAANLELSTEMKNSSGPALFRAMAGRSPAAGTFKETSPGDYEATLTSGTQQGEIEVTTRWNDSLLKATIVKQVNPDSDGDGITDKDEIANGTDPFDPNDPGSIIQSGNLNVEVNNATANGTDTNRIRATVTDANGKPLANVRVNFSADNSATIASRGITDDQGHIVMTLTSLKAGASKVTASVNSKTQSVTVMFRAGPGKPGDASVGGNTGSVIANGSDKVTVTFPVTDAVGNPAPGQTVDITITYPDGSQDTQQVVTDQNGNAVIDVDSTQAGNINVGASTGSGSVSTDISFIPDSATATLPATGGLAVVNNNATADGTATNSVRAKVVDANGNPVPQLSVTFNATNGATITATGVTDAKGEVLQTLTNNTRGVSVVTATVNGVSRTADVTFNADSSSAVLPATGGLVAVDTGALANGTATNSVRATVTDASGNPLEGILVNFSATNSATISATGTTDANGEITQTLTSTAAGTSTVTASVNGSVRTANVSFIADSSSATLPANGGLTVVDNNAAADGNATNSVLATVNDANGNPVEGVTVTFSASNNATITGTGTTDANGEVTRPLTSTTAGDSTVTATINGTSRSAVVSFVADSSSATLPATGGLTVVDNNAVANGTATNRVRATVNDANGNPVEGVTVTFSASNNATITGTGTTDANGEVTRPLTSTTAGDSTVTATINGTRRTANVTFVADSTTASINTGDLAVLSNHAEADGLATNRVRATVTDANGNPVEGVAVTFSANNNATVTGTGNTNADGEVTRSLTSTTAGTTTVTASLNGADITVDVVFTAHSASATIDAGNMTVVDNNAAANGNATNSVQVTVTDANGNPVEGATVAFSATNNATITGTGTTDADGEVLQTLTSDTAGTSTVTATINGTSRTAVVTFVADSTTATIATGNLAVVTTDAIANGTATNSVRATVTDANGNPVEGASVTFSATNNATVIGTDNTDANGEVTRTLTSTSAGNSTVTANINGNSRTAVVNFIADSSTATLPATGGLAVVDTGAAANGNATNSVRATVTDANGNPVEGVTVSFSATNGATIGVTGTTDADGEVLQTLTNTTMGDVTVTATVNGVSRTALVRFVGDSATATITAGNLVVVSNDAVADGNATNSVSATVTDANGNAVEGATVTFSASNGATATGTGTGTTDVNGAVTQTFTSTTNGSSTVTASVNGNDQTVNIDFTGTVQIANLSVVTDDSLPDGTSENVIRVTLENQAGQPVVGETVTVNVGGGVNVVSVAATDATGTADISLTKSGDPVEVTVQVSTPDDSADIDTRFVEIIDFTVNPSIKLAPDWDRCIINITKRSDGQPATNILLPTATYIGNAARTAWVFYSSQNISTSTQVHANYMYMKPNDAGALTVVGGPSSDDLYTLSGYAYCASPYPVIIQ